MMRMRLDCVDWHFNSGMFLLWLLVAITAPRCAAFIPPPHIFIHVRGRPALVPPEGRTLQCRSFLHSAPPTTTTIITNDDDDDGNAGGIQNDKTAVTDHLEKKAPVGAAVEQPVVLELDGRWYNLTEWAREGRHPGGLSVLHKLHGKNATKAFHAVGHSPAAFRLRESFLVASDSDDQRVHGRAPQPLSLSTRDDATRSSAVAVAAAAAVPTIPSSSASSIWKRVRQKMFTKEDPGVHKYLGIYVLGHFVYRYSKALSARDPTAGLGTATPLTVTLCFLLPHAILSLSSFIFHVPAERIVGKPMIWQEYRGHNVVFALRSIVCIILASVGLAYGHVRAVRQATMVASLATVLLTALLADEATARWRINNQESTTATMPYWAGCTAARQRQFKTFYAISQYGATLACLATSNPFWPFMVLLPIQLASFQMTLVRKGFMSVKFFHFMYAASLVLPYLMSLKHYAVTNMVQIPLSFGLAVALYWLRTMGVNKYWLWTTVGAVRIVAGDWMLSWQIWL
jgi:cytochrome b involved in lipid metabolism